ncbi:MAG: hypothetical protein QF662_06865 [Phycisphaerae bacterium]|nr:hypothetical protein [Phycisphaerae bacterium]
MTTSHSSGPSHNTVTVDEENLEYEAPGKLLGMLSDGKVRFVDLRAGGTRLKNYRRACTLIEKADGLPLLLDVFDVEGGRVHDYNIHVNTTLGLARIAGMKFRPRRGGIYQAHSNYPITSVFTAHPSPRPWSATWDLGGLKVRATVLSECDEVVRYRPPAWRSREDIVFLAKSRLCSLALRRKSRKSRYVVLYEVYCGGPQVVRANLEKLRPEMTVSLRTRDAKMRITVAEGNVEVESA